MSIIKKHRKDISWEEGSDNVFADLDMPDAEEKLAKVKLAFRINEIIGKKSLKQIEAAKLLGIDQSKISLLHCGQLSDFSIERLAHFLVLLNQDVEIVIRQTKSHHGCLRVVYA
jgi:predicted XRE-type DNA-binding protein